jgi:hypothetical protein
MSEDGEVVSKTELQRIKGRPKHSEKYQKWFIKVQTLKDDQALKIKLPKNSPTTLPSPPAVRFAIQRWNKENPDKKIGQVLKNSRTDEPIIYLYRQKQEKKADDE